MSHESLATGGGSGILGTRHLSGVFVASAVAADPGGRAAAAELADRGGWRLSTIAGVSDGASLAQAMEHLADLHRGETIAIVATRGMIEDALGTASPLADPVTVSLDASGWSVRRP
jgi:hypothetical protein